MLFDENDNLKYPWIGAVLGIIAGVVLGVMGASDTAIFYTVSIPFLVGFVVYLIK